MRGKNTFSNVFNTNPAPEKRKGRSTELIAHRNRCLMERYYYYGHFTDKRFDAIIEQLSHEFFLSKQTIPDLMDKNLAMLIELKEKKPPKSYFEKRWPHMRW